MSIIIHNPTETPVRDYPIQDPKNGEVKLWSINAGETLEFPDFAGKYLLEMYGFLQRIVTSEQLQQEQEEQKKVDQGRQFSQVKIIDEQGGDASMVASVEGDAVNSAIGSDVQLSDGQKRLQVKGEKTCAECQQTFSNVHDLRNHYATAHVSSVGK